MGFDFGKSESSQQSQQQSQQTSSQRQEVWGGQTPFLQGLYQTGSDMLRGLQGSQGGVQYAQPAFEAWSRMLSGGGNNPALAGAIQTAQARAGEGFAENVLPALTSSAIGSGNLGGARGQIAAGLAGREATREQSRIAESMTAADYGQQQQRILQALQMSGGLAGLNASSFAPLAAYAQILGRPTVLGFGESQGTGSGSSSGSSESWRFGVGPTG